ncbi:MAG: hypothetical protein U1A25_03165 [Candidatus Sungbacteria bacterium]|nr:hypothetical protein [bacterium]MDZ4260643.1 hypothetical protein [Candidatus Sungbacteria bacterium]
MYFPQNIYNRLGNKTTLIVFVLVPLIFVFIFFGFSRHQASRSQEIKTITAQTGDTSHDVTIDSDQDGLKDWEEDMHHTDPHSPDTDNDGTNDADEIAQSRDPRKAGPNDTQIQKTFGVLALDELPPATQTITQQLAEILGKDFLIQKLKNPNLQIDPEIIANKMATVATSRATTLVKTITREQIIIIPDSSREAVQNYLETSNAIFVSSFGNLKKENGVAQAYMDALENKDNSRLDDIAPTLRAYDVFLAHTKKIPVPEYLVSIHLDYLTATIKEEEAIRKIKDSKNDPMLGVVGLGELLGTTKQFEELSKQYKRLYQHKGIVAQSSQ